MNRAKAVAHNFLKQKDFNMWHHWAYDEKLTEVMFDDPGHQCDYLHAMRMEISAGSDWMLEELEQQEEYELCHKIKEHTKELRVEALRMEMETEKLL